LCQIQLVYLSKLVGGVFNSKLHESLPLPHLQFFKFTVVVVLR